MTLDPNSRLELDALVDDPQTRIVVCCGAGGVGKTTTAAAIGLRAAERGRRAVVLTIDPARRLAQSMGLTELDNTPRRVPGVDATAGGELHAMMLDMKRTFDEVVEAHAEPQRARAILENPFYQSLSAGFAGTQEYMAMEKLGQLRARDDWDLIVVDTPPSRSALDFLDAPKRLGSFLDGKFIRLLMAPAKAGGRAGMKFVNLSMAGLSVFTGAINKLLGAGLLRDVQTFVAAMDTMFGGFRTRADATYRLLQAPGTAFLVVAAPERDALREAAYFVERLDDERMPLSGLVLNRVHTSGADWLSTERALAAAENLEDEGIVDRGSGKGNHDPRPSPPESTLHTAEPTDIPKPTDSPEPTAAQEPESAPPASRFSRGARPEEGAQPQQFTERGIPARSDRDSHAAAHAENRGTTARDTTAGATSSGTPVAPSATSASPSEANAVPAEGNSGTEQRSTPTGPTKRHGGTAMASQTSTSHGGTGDAGDARGTTAPGNTEIPEGAATIPEGAATESADGTSGPAEDRAAELAAWLLRLHAEHMRLLTRERRTRDRFTALHPEVPVAEVAALPGDVHDLSGLRAIGELLAGQPAAA